MSRLLIPCLIAMGLLACNVVDDRPPYDLNVRQSSATSGIVLHTGLVRQGGQVTLNEGVVIDGNSIDLIYSDVLAKDASYDVYVFEDLDGNTRCDPSDRAWHRTLSAVNQTVTVDLTELAPDASACSFFATTSAAR